MSDEGKVIGIIALILVVLLVLGIVPPGISCCYSVPAGSTGILTTYGKIESTSLESGFHFKKPWQRVVLLDNKIQTFHVSSGVKNATCEDTAETKDQQLIPVFDFEVQYRLDSDNAFILYSNYGEDYRDKVLTNNILAAIKTTFSEYLSDDIVSKKQEIPEKVKERIQTIVEPLGINIVLVNMCTYDFSPEYTKLLEERAMLNAQLENERLAQEKQNITAQTEYDVAVKKAQQEAETLRIQNENANEIAIAKATNDAEVAKIEADKKAYTTTVNAEAQAAARMKQADAMRAELQAQNSMMNEYTIAHEAIEKWDGHIPNIFGGNNMSVTDLTDIVNHLFDENN